MQASAVTVNEKVLTRRLKACPSSPRPSLKSKRREERSGLYTSSRPITWYSSMYSEILFRWSGTRRLAGPEAFHPTKAAFVNSTPFDQSGGGDMPVIFDSTWKKKKKKRP